MCLITINFYNKIAFSKKILQLKRVTFGSRPIDSLL